ncbi:AraC family transcriptional regulator [Mucilaginibacter sp. SJ]|uniref:AraC family transcriptional regulator n=1 Tax=Mucilaginibacter sp. SJ TaxID=3029053 RepID=UPI0023A96451|nr:helix-turn-helix domain-containing protein [Mucilaginibacter sp. SJ]WEA01805.1 helix-turn-helix domain-containing protein [Mucilaginibacter sp. SJ]
MRERSNKKKHVEGITRCGTAFERHLHEGIVDLDKGYEDDPLITIYKLEDILPQLNNYLPPVRQSGQWISLVTKGAGEKSIADHYFEIRDHTLFLAGKRASQSSRYYFPHVQGYTVIFDIEKLSSLLHKGGIIRERKVLTALLRPYLYLTTNQSQRLAEIMNAIYEEKIHAKGAVTELMALKIAELLIQCDRLFERERLIRHDNQHFPVLQKFLSLVDENVHRQHRSTFYHRTLDLQASQLNMILRSHGMGNSGEIIRNKLITDMKLLLHTTRLSVGAIANALGFNSARSCSQYFTRNTGISPSTFRGNQDAVIRTLGDQVRPKRF